MSKDELEAQQEKIAHLLHLIEEMLAVKVVDNKTEERHNEEHRFLRKLIEREEVKRSFWISVANRVVSGGAWSFVVAVTAAVIFSIKEGLKIQ